MFDLDFINEKVRRKIEEFTPQQRIFAEYVLNHTERLAFLTIRQVAVEAEISQATVVRFCTALGYEGYSQLSREVQQAIQADMGGVGRFNMAHSIRGYTEQQAESGFERVLKFEIESLVNLAQSIKTEEFYHCVNLMAAADRICIIGCLMSRVLAHFFGDSLCKIFPNVDIITRRDAMSAAILNRLTSKSLVFLFSFPRYPRETWELETIAAGKKATILAITNSHVSPIVPLADFVFYIPVSLHGFVDSYSAPIAFCNALITEFSEQVPEKARKLLEVYDDYMQRLRLLMIFKEQKKPEIRDASVGGPGSHNPQ